MHRQRLDLNSYCQLIGELINGSVRRHTFSQAELELLFDLQNSRMRKSSRPEMLRRYLRSIQQRSAVGEGLMRLSAFLERENPSRYANANPAASVSLQVAALPHAG